MVTRAITPVRRASKYVGRAAAAAVLASVAIVPLAGVASAAEPAPAAGSSAPSDRCWYHHGVWYCHGWGWDHDHLLDLDAGLL